jgi:hypothetical protein
VVLELVVQAGYPRENLEPHHCQLLLACHHSENQRRIVRIQVSQLEAEELLGRAAARRGMSGPFQCSMPVALGRDECHLRYRHRSRWVRDSAESKLLEKSSSSGGKRSRRPWRSCHRRAQA